jgi:hypothetical protein
VPAGRDARDAHGRGSRPPRRGHPPGERRALRSSLGGDEAGRRGPDREARAGACRAPGGGRDQAAERRCRQDAAARQHAAARAGRSIPAQALSPC